MASTARYFGSDTKLMLHCDGSDGATTFTDSSGTGHTVTAAGDAQIDTAQSKFGGASGLFDGTGDWLTVGDSAEWDPGTGDFTIDFWVRFNTVGSDSLFNSRTDQIVVNISSGGGTVVIAGSTVSSWSLTWNTDQWYHFAIVRTSSTLKVFIDGDEKDSDANSTDLATSAGLVIGNKDDLAAPMDGWIDEVRFVVGTAVWTGNFTPPDSPYVSERQRGAMLAVL